MRALFALFFLAQAAISEEGIDPGAISRESVHPVFEHPDAVENRAVPLTWRTQLGVNGGLRRGDPYFNSEELGASLTFYFAEEHGVQLSYSSLTNHPSPASTALKNPDLLPNPDSYWLLSYKILPYYGKVSFSKLSVFNMNLYGTLGAGQIHYPGKAFPLLSAGIGDDLYFTKNWGMSIDIRGIFYDGPDAASKNLAQVTSKPGVSEFGTIQTFNLLINLGVVRLF